MQPAHNLRLTTYQIKSIRGNTQEIWKRNEREHTKFIVHVTHELKEEETKEKIERGIEIQRVKEKERYGGDRIRYINEKGQKTNTGRRETR